MYVLDYINTVLLRFTIEFLNKCRSIPNEFHPVDVTRIDKVESPKEVRKLEMLDHGRPSVMYKQKTTNGYLFCGISSALDYFGYYKKA